MTKPQIFTDAIDTLTGLVSFRLPLFDLPGPEALASELALHYSSDVGETVSHWNLTHPTGEAGLGWRLPRWRILLQAPFGAGADAGAFYLSTPQTVSRLIYLSSDTEGQHFTAENEPIWRIVFDSGANRWTVTDQNGIRHVFDGEAAGETAAAWGDWIASTNETAHQRTVSVAWNRTAMVDLFGNTVSYGYDIIDQTLGQGGKSYSQESYLTSIVGAYGDTITLRYSAKSASEYAAAYTDPAAPNAYQSALGTKYLASVSFKPALAAAPAATIVVTSDTSFIGGNGSDARFTKRRLLGLETQNASGQATPGPGFAYAASNDPLTPGALTQVTLPTGGTVTYTYGRAGGSAGVLSYSERSVQITAPVVSGITFSNPKLYLAGSYAVATWVGSDNRLSVVPYRWEGRWLEGAVQTIADGGGATVEIALGDSLFAVAAGSKLLCAYMDPQAPDKWIASANTPFGASSVITGLAAGDRFVAALSGATRQLRQYDFASLAWAEQPVETLGGATSKGVVVAAQGNRLCWGQVSGSQATLTVRIRSHANTWSTQAASAPWHGAGTITGRIELARAGALFAVESVAGGTTTTAGYASAWYEDRIDLTALGSFGDSHMEASASGMTLRLDNVVWRFSGSRWVSADLAKLGLAAGETLGAISFAEDLVSRQIKSSSGQVTRYDLVAYDANTATWSERATAAKPASGAGHATAPTTVNGPSRYAVTGASLYYMSSDLSWAVASGTQPPLSTAVAGTVSVVQSDFLLYQTTDAGVATANVAFLGNGVASAPVKVAGALVPPGDTILAGTVGFAAYTGTWDGAGFALTLYRPVSGAVVGKQLAITVTKVTADPGYSAETVTPPGAPAAQSINGPTLLSYGFDITGATVTANGQPRFNHVTTYPGSDQLQIGVGGKSDNYMFNGLASSETPVKPPPVNAGTTNATGFPALVIGISYLSEATKKSSGGDEAVVSSDTSYIWCTLTSQPNGWTSYSRRRQVDKMLDQVVATTTTSYSAQTGLPVSIDEKNKAPDGTDITTTTALKYFWEEYDQSRGLNLLTPVILTTKSAKQGRTTTPIESQAVTWAEAWPSGVAGWAPSATYRRTLSTASVFNAWQPGATIPGGWQNVFKALNRNQRGAPLLTQDTIGNTQSTIYSSGDIFALADSDNAPPDAFSFYGAETYESPGNWTAGSGRPMSALITAADSHTGRRCLSLGGAGAASTAISSIFAPAAVDQIYLVGFWVRLLNGFDPAHGAAAATATLHWTEGGTAKSAALATLNLGAAAAAWNYKQTLLDFPTALGASTPDAGSVYALIQLENANTQTAIYLDELRLAPLNGGVSARVFDAQSGLVTAEIDANGQSDMIVYDSLARPLARMNALRQIVEITPAGFSRQLKGSGDFQPASPNTLFKVTPGTNSNYDDFRSESPDAWSFMDAGGTWSITGGELVYTGGTATGLGGLAQPKNSNTANFAAWVEVQPGTGSSAALGDGKVFLQWVPGSGGRGTYVFARDDSGSLTTLQTTAEMAFGTSWLLIAIDGLYYAAINGVPVMALELQETPSSGKLTLAGGTSTRFDNLMRIDEPSVSVTFTDGLGREMQTATIEGRVPDGQTSGVINIMVDGAFPDQMGRPVFKREPLNATLGLSSAAGTASQLLLGAPTVYVETPNGPSPTLQSYFDTGIGGILAYVAEYFENSPLGRITQIFAPRPSSDGAGTDSVRTIRYDATDSPTPPSSGPVTGGGTNFRVTETTVAIGTETGSGTIEKQVNGEIRDISGNVLSTYQGPEGATSYLQQNYTYDGARRLESVSEAQAAPTGGGARAGAGAPTYKQTIGYDDLNRIISVTGPDAGQTQVIYDAADRLRFSMDPAGEAAKVGTQSVQRIRYVRYDVIGRVVESGYIQSADYQWGSTALLDKVEDQGFPKVAGGTGTGTVVPGVWRLQNTWDSDGNANSLNLVGRLWQAKTQDDAAANPFVREMTYDALGQIVNVSETLPWAPSSGTGHETVNTAYDYTVSGQPKSITYPQVGAQGFSVGYAYDRLGRFAGVGLKTSGGEVVDPTKPPVAAAVRYAGYEYDDLGRMKQASLNRAPTEQAPAFSRAMGYDTFGRLETIADPYMAITLGYTAPGEATLTEDKPISMSLSYLLSSDWPLPPSATNFTLAYDGYGRLTEATSSISDAFSFTAPATGTAGGYDKNGNRHNSTHGVSRYTYTYPTATGVPANGISEIQRALTVTQDFEAPNDDRPWSWGANNGGPSGSELSTDNPHGGSHCLKLGGGNALGHQEILTLDSYLDPAATLSVTAWVRTASGYSGTPGNQAYWALSLMGAEGQLGDKVLLVVPVASSWTQQTMTIDLPAIIQSFGLKATVTRAMLKLVNATEGASGATGAAMFVDDISITWNSPAARQQGYDPNGNMNALPQRDLTLDYDPFFQQPKTATLAGAAQPTITWLNDGQSAARSESRTSGVATETTRFFYDMSGNLIALRSGSTNNEMTTYFVNGPGGLIAAEVDDALIFALPDQNGSVRTLVDGTSSQALAAFDFDPFGRLIRVNGQQQLIRPRFAGLDRDPSLGLYLADNQIYDPSLARYLMSSASSASLVPYDATPGMNFSYLEMAGTAALAAGLGGGIYMGYLSLTAAAQLALLAMDAYNAYQDPAGSLANVGLSLAASTLSTYTFGVAYRQFELLVPFTGPYVQFTLGIGAVAVNGAGAGVYRRVFDSYSDPTISERGYFRTDDLARDALFSAAGHALTHRGNFAAAAAKRANYVGAKTEEIYLKFPRLDWKRLADRTYLKSWVIPYKGKTSGRQSPLYNVAKRHGNHHWNAYGYGFAFPIISSESTHAIRFAEMALIGTFGRATHLAGAGAGVTQQLYTPGTLANPAYRRAFADHVWTQGNWGILNPGKFLQDIVRHTPLADWSFSYPVPEINLNWRTARLDASAP